MRLIQIFEGEKKIDSSLKEDYLKCIEEVLKCYASAEMFINILKSISDNRVKMIVINRIGEVLGENIN